MKIKRFVAFVISLCMLLSFAPLQSVALAAEPTVTAEDLPVEKIDGSKVNVDLTQNAQSDFVLDQEIFDGDEAVRIIIVMEGESVIEENASAVLDDETAEKIEELEQIQDEVVQRIEDTVFDGEELQVSYSYTWLCNGVAAEVPYDSIEEISSVKGVKQVLIQPVYHVCDVETDSVASPYTIADGVMFGRESAWAQGYTGKGMKIAVIDTGLDTDHPNFQPLPDEKLTETSATADSVASVLSELNASNRHGTLAINDVYYNTKVAFGFNYCDDNLNITHNYDDMGDHGTHVAGIAAANKIDESEVVGVAPDAQLYIMKVFGYNGGAYTEDIIAALEDALILGADVVNMSLGTNAGFTSDAEEINAIYNRVAETNTVLSVSAGNNYSSGYYNNWGLDQNLTTNPDNAVIGAPATYANVLSVASVENWQVQRNYIAAGDYKMPYTDTAVYYGVPSITSLTEEYGVVYVPGTGEVSDFEGLDVTGKVALVQRGVTSFIEKCANAEAAGAVACIIFNNTAGEFGMDLTDSGLSIPCISITMADGDYIVSALAENPELTLSFPTDLTPMPSETAYEMSDFSSWGAAPDLTLEPDITAPGGNIYSTVNDGYGVMSGTSMSAPNISGMTALVMQYVRNNFDSDTDYRVLVQDLLVSTSVPLMNDEGNYYSPRSQGSGLANVYNAITTKAYLTVDGSDTPKVSLRDDPERTGKYNYSFDIHNISDIDLYYKLDTVAQTEGVLDYGIAFMSGTPLALNASTSESYDSIALTYDVDDSRITDSHDAYLVYCAANGNAINENWTDESFRYDLNGDEAVTTDDVQAYLDELVGNEADVDLDDTVFVVAAGETASVSVNVSLTDNDKAYLDYYYPNGGYVEGFTLLTALNNGGIDLSLPYMGFYGDWTDAPVIDDGYYWDFFAEDYEEGMVIGNQYINILATEFGSESTYLGVNVYVDEPFDISHVSLSPDGNGYFDTVNDIYVSLLRNASELSFRYTDMATGEVYYDETFNNAPKSVFNASQGMIIPFIYSWYADVMYDFKDANGNDLANNTQVLLEVAATGVYEGETTEVWSIPITIDTEAPELLGAKTLHNTETGESTLELTFRDNLSASVVGLLSGDGSVIYSMDPVADVIPDDEGYQNYTVSYDLTGLSGKIMLVLGDYALNEAYYGINLGGEGASYGDLVAYQFNYNTGLNGWVSFDSDVNTDETTVFITENDFVCAEYVGGYVFAQTESGALYGIRYEDMLDDTLFLEATYITQLNNVYQDLAYSYAEGKLYGLYTYVDGGYPTTEINSINLNGEYYDPNMWATIAPYQEDWVLNRGGLYGLTLACDDAGSLYVLGLNYDRDTEALTETAHLWTVGLEYDRWSDSYMLGWSLSEIGDTGLSMDYLQSMTWDHNSEKLYWARFDAVGYNMECQLIEVNVETAECSQVGTLSGETCALFAPLTSENAAKDEHSKIPDMDSSVVGTPILRDSSITMNVGSSQTLGYDFDPWYTDYKEVVWSSDNTDAVTVDANGTITAVGTGSATITAANKADETKLDTVTVEVTALDLTIEGVISAQEAGLGNVTGTSTYKFDMLDGVSSFGTVNSITAPAELNFGLSLATSELGRGSIWACEYGNTGMIYEIDPETGVVKDALQPIDGDMIFGLSYSESMDTFTGIMNFYLYTDLELTHEESEKILNSYDEEQHMFTYHRVNMLEYLINSNTGFITGETGQGASSEIVFCGITGIDGGIKDSYGETYYYDTYKDYLGNWAYSGSVNYQPTQTLVLLDNVGRIWYIDEIAGMSKTSDEWGNVFYTSEDGMSEISFYGEARNGIFEMEMVDDEGNVTYNVFNIRQIIETPLTDMFREDAMPRITYHFSDIEFAGYTAEGDPMFAMSLYDYWNNGTTNELYLYVPGHMTDEIDYETWENIYTPDRLFNLGNTGEYNIIASIHSVTVTGGVDSEEIENEPAELNALGVGIYTGENTSR